MTLRQRILSAIAHPNIAYILLSLGTLGLTIELWSPGAILPGVVGGLSLLLAFFALQVLPINYAGLLLMLFGLLLFALEMKVTSYGLLTIGGIISLVFGSLMLIDSPAPELQLSLGLVLSVVLGLHRDRGVSGAARADGAARGACDRRRRAGRRDGRRARRRLRLARPAACARMARSGARSRANRLRAAIA